MRKGKRETKVTKSKRNGKNKQKEKTGCYSKETLTTKKNLKDANFKSEKKNIQLKKVPNPKKDIHFFADRKIKKRKNSTVEKKEYFQIQKNLKDNKFELKYMLANQDSSTEKERKNKKKEEEEEKNINRETQKTDVVTTFVEELNKMKCKKKNAKILKKKETNEKETKKINVHSSPKDENASVVKELDEVFGFEIKSRMSKPLSFDQETKRKTSLDVKGSLDLLKQKELKKVKKALFQKKNKGKKRTCFINQKDSSEKNKSKKTIQVTDKKGKKCMNGKIIKEKQKEDGDNAKKGKSIPTIKIDDSQGTDKEEAMKTRRNQKSKLEEKDERDIEKVKKGKKKLKNKIEEKEEKHIDISKVLHKNSNSKVKDSKEKEKKSRIQENTKKSNNNMNNNKTQERRTEMKCLTTLYNVLAGAGDNKVCEMKETNMKKNLKKAKKILTKKKQNYIFSDFKNDLKSRKKNERIKTLNGNGKHKKSKLKEKKEKEKNEKREEVGKKVKREEKVVKNVQLPDKLIKKTEAHEEVSIKKVINRNIKVDRQNTIENVEKRNSMQIKYEEIEDDNEIQVTNERYRDLNFKGDVYRIAENKEEIYINDLIVHTDKNAEDLNNCLKLWKHSNIPMEEEENISQYQKEKRNAQLVYEKKVEDIENYRYAVNTIRAADKVEFGKPEETKEGLFSLCKNNIYKYECAKFENVSNKIKDEFPSDKEYGRNVLTKKEKEVLENAEVNKELLHLYKISNSKKAFDAELQEKRKIERNRVAMKIAALKRSLFHEQLKNAYKKKIKSKSYRKYIRNQDKNMNQKILDKLKIHYPDLSEYISKYEEEYAKMRNMGKREKSQKILKRLKKYKNEALKKAVLKNIQEDREEKYALKEMLQKALASDSSSEGDEENGEEDEPYVEEDGEEVEEGMQEKDIYTNPIDKELEKRNLLKYKFIQKGRELRKEEEKGKMERRKLMMHSDQMNDEFDNMENISDSSEYSDNYYVNKNVQKKEMEPVKKQFNFSEQTLKKKRNQLLKDPAFMNELKKAGILDTNVFLEDDMEKVEEEKKEVVIEDVSECNINETNEECTQQPKEITQEINITEEKEIEKQEETSREEETTVADVQKEINVETNNDSGERQMLSQEKCIDSMHQKELSTLIEEIVTAKDDDKKKDEKKIERKPDINIEKMSTDSGNSIKEKRVAADTVADINAIDGEEILKQYTQGTVMYNFENDVYEKFININDENELKKERAEEIELSDSEKVQSTNIKINEWTNLNTIIENEKKKKMKEQEILEKKRNIPLNTITVHDKPDKLFSKYYVNKLPHTQVEEEYEKGLNIMISKELNDPKCFRNLIEPKITSRYGQIIEPIRKSINKLANILKRQKDKRKPNF